MVASRTVFCFFTGVLVVAAPKIIEETVPSHLIESGFGSSTGAIINFQVMVAEVLGLGYPTNATDAQLEVTTWWRAFYIAPIPFLVIAVIQNLFEHRNDGLLYHVGRDEKKKSISILKRIYPDSNDQLLEDMYADFRTKDLESK